MDKYNSNNKIINKAEHDGIAATIEICSNPKLKAKIIEGLNTPESELLNEDETNW